MDAAARLCARLRDHAPLSLVVRGQGIETDELVRLAGVPLELQMNDQRGLHEAIDLGMGPVRSRRGPLYNAAQQVLAGLSRREGGEAA